MGNQHSGGSYFGLLRLHNDGDHTSGIWGFINFPSSNTSTSANDNYYMIGRGTQYSDKCLTIHTPTEGSIDFCYTGSNRTMKIKAGTVGIGNFQPDIDPVLH